MKRVHAVSSTSLHLKCEGAQLPVYLHDIGVAIEIFLGQKWNRAVCATQFGGKQHRQLLPLPVLLQLCTRCTASLLNKSSCAGLPAKKPR